MFMILSIICVWFTLATKRALLIIDVQNDFLPTGSLPVPKGDEVIPTINALRKTKYFDFIVRSQDWHPKNHISFASNHNGTNPFDVITLNYTQEGKVCGYSDQFPNNSVKVCAANEVAHSVQQTLWPDHCIQQSSGSQFASNMEISASDTIVQKGYHAWIDSYSAFFDNGHFSHTKLYEILTSEKIDEVYVTGLALDFCVYYTAKDAHQLGFKTYLIEDATRGINAESSAAAIADLKQYGVKIIQSKDIPTLTEDSKDHDWVEIGLGAAAGFIIASSICFCWYRKRNTYPRRRSSECHAINYVAVTDP